MTEYILIGTEEQTLK
jgi:WD40 repeat protein